MRDVAAAAGEEGFIEDRVGDSRIRLIYMKPGDTVRVETLSGDRKPVPVAYSFWFAVNAIMPDVEIFEPPTRHAASGKADSRVAQPPTPRTR